MRWLVIRFVLGPSTGVSLCLTVSSIDVHESTSEQKFIPYRLPRNREPANRYSASCLISVCHIAISRHLPIRDLLKQTSNEKVPRFPQSPAMINIDLVSLHRQTGMEDYGHRWS
jgi:hypothetical protein